MAGNRAQRHTLISIHAPREGGDLSGLTSDTIYAGFQSTPPARGATEEGEINA